MLLPYDWQGATTACPKLVSQIQSVQYGHFWFEENQNSDSRYAKLKIQNGSSKTKGFYAWWK